MKNFLSPGQTKIKEGKNRFRNNLLMLSLFCVREKRKVLDTRLEKWKMRELCWRHEFEKGRCFWIKHKNYMIQPLWRFSEDKTERRIIINGFYFICIFFFRFYNINKLVWGGKKVKLARHYVETRRQFGVAEWDDFIVRENVLCTTSWKSKNSFIDFSYLLCFPALNVLSYLWDYIYSIILEHKKI